LIAHVSGADRDIDKRKTAFSATINNQFYVERKNTGEHAFTNNKVFLSHFKPPKFNIALAI